MFEGTFLCTTYAALSGAPPDDQARDGQADQAPGGDVVEINKPIGKEITGVNLVHDRVEVASGFCGLRDRGPGFSAVGTGEQVTLMSTGSGFEWSQCQCAGGECLRQGA